MGTTCRISVKIKLSGRLAPASNLVKAANNS